MASVDVKADARTRLKPEKIGIHDEETEK